MILYFFFLRESANNRGKISTARYEKTQQKKVCNFLSLENNVGCAVQCNRHGISSCLNYNFTDSMTLMRNAHVHMLESRYASLEIGRFIRIPNGLLNCSQGMRKIQVDLKINPGINFKEIKFKSRIKI